MPRSPRVLKQLTPAESLHLLSGVSLGRILFTDRALPAVRPVNHVVCGGDVIIRTHLTSKVLSASRAATVVAYEADNIDPIHHIGWSVVVTGTAALVSDAEQAAHYRTLLRPWLDRPVMDHVLRIRTDLVTGFELVPG